MFMSKDEPGEERKMVCERVASFLPLKSHNAGEFF